MTAIDPAARLSVTLEAQQWNQVLACICEAPVPYRIIAPIIQALHQQLQPQQEADDSVVSLRGDSHA